MNLEASGQPTHHLNNHFKGSSSLLFTNINNSYTYCSMAEIFYHSSDNMCDIVLSGVVLYVGGCIHVECYHLQWFTIMHAGI